MPQPTQFIKMNKDGLVVVKGANQLATLKMCGLQSQWAQYYTNRLELGPGANNIAIDFGMMGTDVTFLSLKATYSTLEKDLSYNYLSWYFVDTPTLVYPMGELMVLTGNDTQRIKPLIISNPNTSYPVILEILAATTSIISTVYTIVNPSSNLIIQGVTLAGLITEQQGVSIKIVVDGEAQAYINMQNVSNIEISGMIVIIDDNGIGKIYLEFNSEEEALQGYSALNWLWQDLENRTLPVSEDLTAPVVTWGIASGDTFVLTSSPYFGIISKTDIISFITSIIDDRDGVILVDETAISISGDLEEITNIGIYIVTVTVSDLASNETISSIEINVV